MTSINLLKVAAMPGSGSGCQSALPAEVTLIDLRKSPDAEPYATVDMDGVEYMAFRKAGIQHSVCNLLHETVVRMTESDLAKWRRIQATMGLLKRPADLLDAAGGGE